MKNNKKFIEMDRRRRKKVSGNFKRLFYSYNLPNCMYYKINVQPIKIDISKRYERVMSEIEK